MNLQDLIGKNTTPEWKPNIQNRLTFPYTNSYLEVEYDKLDDMEVWTCYVVFNADPEKTHFPICSYIKNA